MMQTTRLIRRRIDLVSIGFLLAISPASAEIRSLAPTALVTAADGLYGGIDFSVSPDNSKVFFVAREQEPFYATTSRLYEVPVVGGPITTRTTESNGIAESVLGYGFAPSGTDLVILEGNYDCLGCTIGDAFVMPVATGSPQQITFDNGVVGNPVWQPEFSQDGSRLLYLEIGFNRPQELFSVPLDGSSPPARLNDPVPFYNDEVRSDWKLLPGGNDVIYVATQAGNIGYNLYRVGASGGTPQRLNVSDDLSFWTNGTNSFAIDSSGESVAYGVRRGPAGLPTVMGRGIDGGPEVELTPNMAKHVDARLEILGFAQDQVVFQADFDNANRFALYAAPVDGGPAKQLGPTYGYVADSAVISPNRNAVIFRSNTGSAWSPYPEREVLFYDVAAESTRSLGVYPSGEYVSIQYNSTGDYFLMQGDGIDSPRLFTSAGDFVRTIEHGFTRFHPDGEHFLYYDSVVGAPSYWSELFMERLDGTGEPVHISNDPVGGPGVEHFTFSNDGTMLLYSRTEFGQPLQIFAVQLAPEPGSAIIAVVAVTWMGVIRRTRSRSSI
jgi:Tol biopolymer transport system component